MKEPKLHHVFTLEQIEEASEAQAGYCIECGAWRDCCEPDATEYECEECGAKAVYGAEELLLMGYVSDGKIDGDFIRFDDGCVGVLYNGQVVRTILNEPMKEREEP